MSDQTEFFGFLKKIGVDGTTSEKLWKDNICSVKKLASTKPEKLRGIADDYRLVNIIHPQLNKYAFPIAMAPNPYEKALSLLRNEAAIGSSPPIDSVQSDAIGFLDDDTDPSPQRSTVQSDATPYEVEDGYSSQHSGSGKGIVAQETSGMQESKSCA